MEDNSSFSDINTQLPRKYKGDLMNDDQVFIEAETTWMPICNNQGFVYFYNKKTGECQYSFPKIYNPNKKEYSHIL